MTEVGRVARTRKRHRTAGRRPPVGGSSGEPRSLARHGIQHPAHVFWDLGVPALYEESLRRREGQVAHGGALVVRTGQHTGRSPDDKFIVREPSSAEHIWWGAVNRPFEATRFDQLHERVLAHLRGKALFVQDCFVGADPAYQHPVRVITETAWHSLFARTMFLPAQDAAGDGAPFQPECTVLHAPNFHAEPSRDGTNSAAFILVHFGKRLVLIGGTSYAGEIKKSVFTIMNYLLPREHVLSMHCSANVGADGTVAIFNFENGCYAKMIRLSPEAEPEIYAASHRFGTVLENVTMDPVTRQLDLDDDSLTENTRGAYPLGVIPNASATRMAGHPQHIVMLTCDAFGVMPPLAKLTREQAMYHFVSGYTAKVAGTETGVTEPKATFSACFGAPFMALHPYVYARLLGEKITQHGVRCWLINTGWTGGPYGVGRRIQIGDTRAMVEAALGGALDAAPTRLDPTFRFATVTRCPGVPDMVLDPRSTWRDSAAYDAKAQELAARFRENFVPFADCEPAGICEAGPTLWKQPGAGR